MTYELLFASPEALSEARERAFSAQMDRVFARHAYYRARFGELGLKRRDFSSLADLARLPLTTKAQYVAAPGDFVLDPADGDDLPDALAAPEMRAVWDTMYTTGSTGKPVPFVSTSHDFFRIMELQRNMLSLRGIDARDVIANLFPLTRAPHGAWIRPLHAAAAAGIRIVSALPGNPSPEFTLGRDTDEVVRLVASSGATVLWGVPSYLRQVAARAAELRVDLPAVRMLLVTGEGLPEAARTELVAAFARAGAKAVVSISYGATEMQGGMVECTPGSGYHNPAPDQLLLEVVDPVTHAPLPDGERGMVVLTHLRRSGTVLLRYALGDLSVLSRDPCPHCGATTERLVEMPRRMDSYLKVKGMLVNPEAAVRALEGPLAGREFQLRVERSDPGSALSPDLLLLDVASEGPPVDAGALAACVKQAIGVTPQVRMVGTAQIADPSAGWKAKRFRDAR